MEIVDKRRPPTVQTTTLPPNPNPSAPASWAHGTPQGARPPAAATPPVGLPPRRPLGGAAPAAAAPAAAPAPKPWELATPPVLTAASSPAEVDVAIQWALGAGGGPEAAFEWFGQTPQWEGAILRYLEAGGPVQGWDAKWLGDVTEPVIRPAESKPSIVATGATVVGHDRGAQRSGVVRTDVIGTPAGTPPASTTPAAPAAAPGPSGDPGRRWSKGLREQAKKLFASGATDEQIADAIAFPLDKIREYREGLRDQPVGGVDTKPTPAAAPTAAPAQQIRVDVPGKDGAPQPPVYVWHRTTGAKMQLLSMRDAEDGSKRVHVRLESGDETGYDLAAVVNSPSLVVKRVEMKLPDGTPVLVGGEPELRRTLRRTGPGLAPSIDHAALLDFIFLGQQLGKVHDPDPTPADLDQLALRVIHGANSWMLSRGTMSTLPPVRREERNNTIPNVPPGEEVREFSVTTVRATAPPTQEAPASGASFPDDDTEDPTDAELAAAHR